MLAYSPIEVTSVSRLERGIGLKMLFAMSSLKGFSSVWAEAKRVVKIAICVYGISAVLYTVAHVLLELYL